MQVSEIRFSLFELLVEVLPEYRSFTFGEGGDDLYDLDLHAFFKK